jgi:Uma2 family endonuclease
MNVALRGTMTLEQFLAWEERQELRYEFDGFRPVAMTGGTEAHSLIQANLITALSTRLKGKPCRAHGSHMKIEVAGRIRYPDAFVVCSEPAIDRKVITDPVVVFEILSEGSGPDDLVRKNAEYQATPSIQRYVVLQQATKGATVFARRGKLWAAEVAQGPDAVLDTPEIGIAVPLGDLYLAVPLAPTDGDPPA